MSPENLLNILNLAERLKNTTRHCYTSEGRHESVAEHSWRAALMAYFLKDEFPEADIQHNESDLETWIPEEYELNKTYADDKVQFSEYLTALRKVIREDTLRKLKKVNEI